MFSKLGSIYNKFVQMKDWRFAYQLIIAIMLFWRFFIEDLNLTFFDLCLTVKCSPSQSVCEALNFFSKNTPWPIFYEISSG